MTAERVKPDAPLTADEAGEVIREATRLQQQRGRADLSRDDVIAMGKELGLSPEAVDQALAHRAEKAKLAEQIRKEQRSFFEHLVTYASTVGVLALIDLLSGPGWWVQWVAMGWGIGIFFHGFAALKARWFPESIARERSRRSEERQARRAERREERGAPVGPLDGPLGDEPERPSEPAPQERLKG